jgi:DNA-binding SARP family transcriptional activator
VPSLKIRLLGAPSIERGGEPAAPPRGRKAWAVLAYLALAERPVSRATLASLLFADADDPLGALRWTLAQLRRTLGLPAAVQGDPIALNLPDDALLDAAAVAGGDGDPDLVRGDLLEGVEPGGGAVFDAWLLVERRRLAGLSGAVLREAALTHLGAGRALDGAALATRALAFSPYDEDVHELLVHCLARAGELGAARHHANACEVLFRRELGRVPHPRVRRASVVADGPLPAGDRDAAAGQLAAGRAALDAGAVEPGVACLRSAVAEARAATDPLLLGRSLAALGAALVHAVRGADAEGATVLHEALVVAEAAGDRETAGKVCRELGFVEVQAARGVAAGRWLVRASELAAADDERAAVLGVRGMALSDRAHYEAAIGLLERSVATARACGDARQTAWSLGCLARALFLRGELDRAAAALDESLELIEREGWIALRPFPEALRAEVALRRDEHDRADALLERAFALGCRLGDPCWEGMAARGRGLLHEAQGDRARALEWLRDAAERAARVSDPYVWIHAHCLDALVGVEIAGGAPDAVEHLEALERIAARGGFRELVVRAALHRARLGDATAAATGRLLAEAIDNPALHAEILAPAA